MTMPKISALALVALATMLLGTVDPVAAAPKPVHSGSGRLAQFDMSPVSSLAKRAVGEGTYYDVGAGFGACGEMHYDGEYVVALNDKDWNGSPCFSCVAITANGLGPIKAKIVDKCPGCKSGDLDLSPAVFQAFYPLGVGRFTLQWTYTSCGADPAPVPIPVPVPTSIYTPPPAPTSIYTPPPVPTSVYTPPPSTTTTSSLEPVQTATSTPIAAPTSTSTTDAPVSTTSSIVVQPTIVPSPTTEQQSSIVISATQSASQQISYSYSSAVSSSTVTTAQQTTATTSPVLTQNDTPSATSSIATATTVSTSVAAPEATATSQTVASTSTTTQVTSATSQPAYSAPVAMTTTTTTSSTVPTATETASTVTSTSTVASTSTATTTTTAPASAVGVATHVGYDPKTATNPYLDFLASPAYSAGLSLEARILVEQMAAAWEIQRQRDLGLRLD